MATTLHAVRAHARRLRLLAALWLIGPLSGGCSSSSSDVGGGDASHRSDAGHGADTSHAVHDAGSGGDTTVSDARTTPPDDGARDAALPPGCNVVVLTARLQSSTMRSSETYAPQADLLSTPSLDGSTGNASHPNTLYLYLDSADSPGSYAVSPFSNYFYGIANGGGISADYTSDGDAGAFTRRYVAVSGSIHVATALTPRQGTGTLSNVAFHEATRNADGTYALVPDGGCYVLPSATWDTTRDGGCAPYTDAGCTAGKYCMPTDAIGDDGVCVTTGTKQLGAPCTLTSATAWDSDCAPGLRCAEFSVDLGETSYTCHQICNVRAVSTGCSAASHCGGGYETCIPIAFLEDAGTEGDEIDPDASVGANCVANPNALYCGATGRPGTCFQDTGADASACVPWQNAVSACAGSGESAGTVTYKQGIDQSTLFCFR